MKWKFLIIGIATYSLTALHAEPFNTVVSAGNIVSQTGNITSQTGFVRAQSHFITPGNLTVGGNATISNATINVNLTVNGNSTVSRGLFSNTLSAGGSLATGNLAAGFGEAATASSYSSVVVGRYNVTTAFDGTSASGSVWVGKDPLFVIGNGSGTAGDPDQYRNAFAVYKDGTIIMSKMQGDILAGQFGVPPTP